MTIAKNTPALHVPPTMQWTALSERSIRAAVREGDLLLASTAPVTFFVCVHVPLRRSMEATGLNYAQYLLPLIALQAMFFASMFAADRAGREVLGGMGTRLRSMPVLPWVPPAARMSANAVRAAAALAGALIIGLAFGFRFHGFGTGAAFIALVLGFGAAVVLASDALGTATGNPELGGTVLFVPQLLLMLTSTGFVPAEGFPGWIQPFARNQPVSVVTAALRELADGRTGSEVVLAVVWTAGLLVAAALFALRVERRRR
ncbi:ABC transporter permease [Nocardia arthritidis]|uniref:ABC transporter permease n=1 Tax=Nocardia arthritidis TaxID=228602 RepID=A0A6G9Y762_9NOCA|nr:ABC transporter permease [Nocardia arthritidis]QIS08927.1 ABC transporter permease [Nocardia arthritidis]